MGLTAAERESRLPDALAALIETAGLSQSELSRRSGVSRAKIGGYIRAESGMTVSTLFRLLEHLGADLVDLERELSGDSERVLHPASVDDLAAVRRHLLRAVQVLLEADEA